MQHRVRVASLGEIAPGSCRAVEASGTRVVVYNVDGALYATSAQCAHQGGPLEDGLLSGTTITCPWHAWQFDIRSGEALFDPGYRIECYPVHVDGDDVHVEVAP